jgi:peptide/nickel transport system permease protein
MPLSDGVAAAPFVPPVAQEPSPASRPANVRRHAWLVRRIALGVVTLVAMSLIVFAATRALPGDAAQAILGPDATPQRLAAVRHQLGLDEPLARQYLDWVGGVARGDFGVSMAAHRPVASLLADPARNSAVLVLLAFLIVVPLSFGLAIVAALRPGRLFDRTLSVASGMAVGLPEFVIAVFLVTLLSTTVLKLFPAVALIPPGDSPLSHLDEMALPLATVAAVSVPYLTRLLRAAIGDALESPYAEMARLQGFPERAVVARHALPNALIPAIQGIALTVSYIAGGIVVVEYVFSYPGLGSALADSIASRDLPMVQATVLVLASFYVVVNLLADVLTDWASPRLRPSLR